MNPLPDHSTFLPLCHTHYLTPDQYFTSFFMPDPLPSRELEAILQSSLLQRSTAESSRELSALRKLNNKQRQVLMFLFKFLTQLSLFSLSLSPLCSLSQTSLFSLSPIPSFSSEDKDFTSFITFCFTNGTFFCILFHTMTYFFNNAFYKLVKTNFDA